MTLYLVTTCDLVTIYQIPFCNLLDKIISIQCFGHLHSTTTLSHSHVQATYVKDIMIEKKVPYVCIQ